MAAHNLGRIRAYLRGGEARIGPDFLSGESGHVAGRRGELRRIADGVSDRLQARRAATLDDAGEQETLKVLVLAVARPALAATWVPTREELRSSRHDVEIRETTGEGRGKFENLNALIGDTLPDVDWLIVSDDDIVLPPRFLDRFLAAAQQADLKLCQPAHRLHSHAGWPVTRRKLGAAVRETNFVEIGPLTAFHRDTFGVLVPFPELRMGWGLDVHWSALAKQHGWRLGVVDATPILHAVAPVASSYSGAEAIAEARAFLEGRPYVKRGDIRTLRTHR
jgi:hypothetical protein